MARMRSLVFVLLHGDCERYSASGLCFTWYPPILQSFNCTVGETSPLCFSRPHIGFSFLPVLLCDICDLCGSLRHFSYVAATNTARSLARSLISSSVAESDRVDAVCRLPVVSKSEWILCLSSFQIITFTFSFSWEINLIAGTYSLLLSLAAASGTQNSLLFFFLAGLFMQREIITHFRGINHKCTAPTWLCLSYSFFWVPPTEQWQRRDGFFFWAKPLNLALDFFITQSIKTTETRMNDD